MSKEKNTKPQHDEKPLLAVEWLFARLLPFLPFSDVKEREHFRKCLEEAKAREREQKKNNTPNIISPLTQKQQECKAYMDSFYEKYKKSPSVSNVAEALGIKRTAAYNRMKKVKQYETL